MTRKLCSLILCGLLTLPLSACAGLQYSAEPIEAWVVDAETKQPIEGVIVVAHWELVGPMENYPVGQIEVLESVTDKNGRFHFPAWGPKLHLAPFSYLTDSDPELLFFKSGYKYIRVSNSLNLRPKKYYYDGMPGGTKEKPTGSKRRISFWNGETIKMEKFGGTQKEYADHLSFLKTSLGFAYNGEDCEWKQTPLMLVAQHKEMLRLEESKIFNTLQSVERLSGQKKCGSAREFFRNYLP